MITSSSSSSSSSSSFDDNDDKVVVGGGAIDTKADGMSQRLKRQDQMLINILLNSNHQLLVERTI